MAYLRHDVMLPALLAIQRMGSQSSFTRFFQGFNTAGKNLSTIRSLWGPAALEVTWRMIHSSRGCLRRSQPVEPPKTIAKSPIELRLLSRLFRAA